MLFEPAYPRHRGDFNGKLIAAKKLPGSYIANLICLPVNRFCDPILHATLRALAWSTTERKYRWRPQQNALQQTGRCLWQDIAAQATGQEGGCARGLARTPFFWVHQFVNHMATRFCVVTTVVDLITLYASALCMLQASVCVLWQADLHACRL